MDGCPVCRGPLQRIEVDVGVAIQYGPWDCMACVWHELNRTWACLRRVRRSYRGRDSHIGRVSAHLRGADDRFHSPGSSVSRASFALRKYLQLNPHSMTYSVTKNQYEAAQ